MIESMSGSTAIFALCFFGLAFLAAAVGWIFLFTEADRDLSSEHDRLDALRDLPKKPVKRHSFRAGWRFAHKPLPKEHQ